MLVLAIVAWVTIPLAIVDLGIDLAHHRWGWVAVWAALIPFNRWAGGYMWRQRAGGER
jgi:hypothetical protein